MAHIALGPQYTVASAAGLAKIRAARWTFDGRNPAGLDGLRYVHEPTGTVFCYSRDIGHHSSGWWKNPDYERCRHLSLSFVEPGTLVRAPRDKQLTSAWVDAFFGDDRTKLWCEPPYSASGKAIEVWHYRLFCAPDWSPWIPRGEVYSKQFTEIGWKSWSDVQADLAEAPEEARP